MEREIQSLRERLECLEEQKRKEEEREKKKETIEYNLQIIRDAAKKMVEEGDRNTKQYSPYKHVCKDYAEAFEAIHKSLQLINEQLNPPNTNVIKL